jgi:hypothetical protein
MLLSMSDKHSMLRKSPKTFIVSVIALIVIGIAIVLMSQWKRQYHTVFDAIPNSSTAVFESNQTGPVWKKLTDSEGFWPALVQFEHFKRIDMQITLLDSVLNRKDGFHENIIDQRMALALHATENAHGFIFLVELGSNLRFYEVKELIYRQFGTETAIVERNYNKHNIGLLVDNRTGMQFNFSITKGLFIGSFDRSLLELALDQLGNDNKLLKDASFARLRETKGQSVDGYLYVHPTRLAPVMAAGSSAAFKELMTETFTNFSGWAALDLMVKPSELLLNGYTDVKSNEQAYLKHLVAQKPVQPNLFNILPFNTRMLLHFGMENFAAYHQAAIDQDNMASLSQQYSFDFEKDIIQAINGEIALALAAGDPDERALFAARINDQQALQQALSKLASRARGNKPSQRIENTTYAHINIKGLIPGLFGPAFALVDGGWYTLVDNHLLVANNPQTLEEVVRLYRTSRTLDMNENFKRFANNLSYASNILLYTNIREGNEILQHFLDPALLIHIKQNQQVVRNFEGLAVQFSQIAGMIYTNIFLKYNPDYKEEGLIAWKTKLDAPVAGKPFIIEDHITGKYNIVAFDQSNHMYLVSPDGEIYWKKQISEEPMGEVFAVDFYKNGRIQYLFNTQNYLHLIDRNGDNVANYPVKLRSQATNGISLFDYSNKRDYRILINGADKITYNYDIGGREVDGWQKPRSQEIVTKNVERLVANGRDYIIITDVKGNIRIVDRQGRTRISPRGNIDKALHSDFYVNRTNSRGILLTTNRSGKLLYVASNGSLATTDFGSFSPEHFFLYEDFNRNSSVDFIYLDGNKLLIFDRFRKELFNYTFRHTIVTKPVFFNVTRRNRLLGIVSETSKEIFLIDKDGRMIISSGLVGETPFAVGSLHNNNEVNLVTGVGDMLYNYTIY